MTARHHRHFRVERLESREVPAVYAVGADAGQPAVAALADADTGVARLTVSPFDEFLGGVSVACGDVTGDRVPDLIVGAGAGGGPHVKVFDGLTGKEVRSFFPFDPAFAGGVRVACGDVNDDGVADVIVAAGAGGGPQVKVFDGASGIEVSNFFAYDVGFRGGVNLAVADVDGDGRADILTGAGAGGSPHLKAFSGVNGKQLLSTFAYDAGFRGGVNVAAGGFDDLGRALVITGTGVGGGAHVRSFRLDGSLAAEAMIGDPAAGTGVTVGCTTGADGTLFLVSVPGSDSVTAYSVFGGSAVSSRKPLGSQVGLTLSGAEAATDNPVLVWNDVALRTIRSERPPPPRAARALAILHTAVFDAVNAIEQKYQAYLAQGVAPAGASAEAAAIAAAHKTLVALFPTQAAKYDAIRAAQLAVLPDAGKADGIAVGEAAAAAMLANRANDLPTSPPYTPGTNPGEWRPTLPANAAFVLPGWGQLKPFTLTSGDQFRPAAPPALTDAEYTAAFNEVKELGSRTSATRTADQTEIALFWAAGGGTDTPPGMNNRIAEEVVGRKNLSLVDAARTFALLNLAEADAAVVSWDAKRHYNLWRPITAVREADTDGNADTTADAAWLPLIGTPAFPAYTSGHSTFSGAGAAVLTALFGDVPFVTWSPDLPGVARSFGTFTQAAEEAGQSRIYGGIHYQFDNTAGLSTGKQVGDQVVAGFLKPV